MAALGIQKQFRNDVIYFPLVRAYGNFTAVADVVESYETTFSDIDFIPTRSVTEKRNGTPRLASPWFNDMKNENKFVNLYYTIIS